MITTPRTFLASASAVVRLGARVVFADVDADSQNLTAASIEAVATDRTRAVIAVHLAGQACDMAPIMQLADARDWVVIEDCAQAHGARYRGQSVGAIGHIAAWSFCQDKIMTTAGEGGMVTTNQEGLWRKAWALKDHGKSFAAVYERDHAPGYRWLHESFGSNGRMTEIQAAVGRIQLKRMPEWTRRRAAAAAAIRQAAAESEVFRVPGGGCSQACSPECEQCVHAHYKCYLFVRPETLAADWSRDRIVDEVNAMGVPCYTGSCSEVYLEEAFAGTDMRPSDRLPVAKALGETSLMFLVHPTLTDEEVAATCDAVRAVGRRASAP